MTPKEAFKVAFLQKCAAAGLDDQQVIQRIRALTALAQAKLAVDETMVKSAEGKTWLGGLGSSLFGAGKWTAGKTGDLLTKLWPLILAGPPALGVLGGYATARMSDDTFDPEEAQRNEEVMELQRAVERLRNMQASQLHAR